jgi:tetratricopeptide (TPR) repeat protein
MEKLPLSKTPLETTWLHHEIGRCYLEQKNYQDALECGQRSLKSAQEAKEQVWELNATVLIAQSQGKSVVLCVLKLVWYQRLHNTPGAGCSKVGYTAKNDQSGLMKTVCCP